MRKPKKPLPDSLSILQQAQITQRVEDEVRDRLNAWLASMPLETIIESMVVPMIVRRATDHVDRQFSHAHTEFMAAINRKMAVVAEKAMVDALRAQFSGLRMRATFTIEGLPSEDGAPATVEVKAAPIG